MPEGQIFFASALTLQSDTEIAIQELQEAIALQLGDLVPDSHINSSG